MRRTDTGAVIARIPTIGGNNIFLYVSHDGTFVVHNRADGPAQLRRTDSGAVIANLAGEINRLGFTADQLTFAVEYTNAPPEVRRTDTGAVIAILPGQLRIEKFSPDESAFVANHTSGPAELRRTNDGALRRQLADEVTPLGVTFSPDGSAFVVNYTSAPAELRRTSDGVLLSQLAGQIEKLDGVPFSPDGSAFVVNYTDASAELRRTRDGVLLSQLAGHVERSGGVTFGPKGSALVVNYTDAGGELRRTENGAAITAFPSRSRVTFSPDETTLVVRYPKEGLLERNPGPEIKLRSTDTGALLATLVGDVANDHFGGAGRDDLNFAGTEKESGNGVTFSPDGSTLVVRYNSGRGELWDVRGTPRRLTDLGLGVVKAGFVFTSAVKRLAIQYATGALVLLDIAWLRAMRGGSDQPTEQELVRLACEGPFTSELWTTADKVAVELALGSRKPQSCG